MADATYLTIGDPYDVNLARKPDSLDVTAGGGNLDQSVTQQQQAGLVNLLSQGQAGGNTAASSTAGGGPTQQASVSSGGAMSDIVIANSIQSANWSPRTMGFKIDGQTGYAEFTNVFVSGNINATIGYIGGWTINATTITGGNATLDSTGVITLGTGNDIIKLSSVDATYRLWAGNATAASAPFSITKAGAISATSGTIGGNSLTSTTISSTTFVSGPLGSGWNISNTGTAEFQNVTIRGTIRTSVFEKDTISAVNGMVLISKADVLAADMTALDASAVTISGQTTFVNNEVLRIKDGTDDEWMLVTDASGAPVYVVTRDLAGSYAPNTNPIWKKGTAVVSMGVGTGTKTGFVLLDSSSANSPYIDVYGRNSNTYTDYSLHGRFGWLKGITDATVGLSGTDVWGLYTDNAYIKGVIVADSGKVGGATNYWNISSGEIAAVGSGDVILRAGQTDYDTGTGFWFGLKSGVSKFSVGNPLTNKITWDNTTLNVVGRISAINASIATCFESSSRFNSTALVGSGAVNWIVDGMECVTGVTNPSSAAVTWDPIPVNSFRGSPVFSTSIYVIAGSSKAIFCGMGQLTAATLDFTVDHIGFKVVGNVLYATQSDGTTESSTSLGSVANNEIYNLVCKVNGTTSVDYYWRLYRNSGGVISETWSTATTISTNMPIATNQYLTFRCDNQGSTTSTRALWVGATYTV